MESATSHNGFLEEREYLAFISIYVAHEDYNLTESEINWMKLKFGDLIYERQYDRFSKQSDYKNLQDILGSKALYFPGKDGTQKLLDFMTEIFQIDGNYSPLEKVAFTFLARYFKSLQDTY